MKVAILCGGQGTRLREETEYRPKPLLPIGTRPILWHIMKTYSTFGHKDFVLALGYKGEMIKNYYLNYEVLNSDFTLELGAKRITTDANTLDEGDWRITFVDSGQDTQTGGRIKRLQAHLNHEEAFFATYGDGVADLDLDALMSFHKKSGCAVTVTGVRPLSRFGELTVGRGGKVTAFEEKPRVTLDETWINGGYFVMTPKVFDYIDGDDTIFEREPMERLVEDGQLAVFKHGGYWQCMDTRRDMEALESLWMSGSPPWRRW